MGYDRATGLGWAGGYVGDGVATTNLAGRTLADLITGRDTELTVLPWVNHRSPDVGARAAALAGREPVAQGHGVGRQGRAAHRASVEGRHGAAEGHRAIAGVVVRPASPARAG